MAYKNPDDQKANHKRWYEANKERKSNQGKVWHEANRDRHRELRTAWEKRRRQQVAQYKLERGCAKCGYREHPAALHFDHLPGEGKVKEVSQMYKRKWKDVLAEMDKCQILCANCHAIATAERGYPKRKPKEVVDTASDHVQLGFGFP